MARPRHHWKSLSVIFLFVITILSMQLVPIMAQDKDPWLPENLVPITADNGDQLTQLVNWGKGSLTSLTWSVDGKTLVAGSSQGIWLYDATDLTASPRLIEAESHAVGDVLFSPTDNVFASSSCSEPVRIWDVDTLQQIEALHKVATCPKLLGFNPDGTLLITARSVKNFVELWPIDGVDHEEPLLSMEGHAKPVKNAIFSPDGQIVASGDRETVRFWDANSGEELAVMKDFEGPVQTLTFIPGTRILAVGTGYPDKKIHLWDVSSPQDIQEVDMLGASAQDVAFNADGTLMASDDGRTIQLWSFAVENGTVDYMPYLSIEGHLDIISGLVFSPDQTMLASFSDDQTIRIWDVHTGEQIALLAGYLSSPELTYSPDGSLLAITGQYEGIDEAVILLDANTGAVAQVIDSGMNAINCITFSPDGTLLAAGQGNGGFQGVKVWDLATGELHGHYKDASRVRNMAFSPDGSLLAVGQDSMTSNVFVYDVQTRENVLTLAEYGKSVSSVAFSPDGMTLATASFDETAHIWDLQTGEAIASLAGEESAIASLVFSPDGATLVSGGWKHEVWLWNVETLTVRARLSTNVFVRTLAFSPDGKLLAVAGRHHSVDIWDVRSNIRLITLNDAINDVSSVAFSPDGRVLATTGWDGVVRLWGVSTNQ